MSEPDRFHKAEWSRAAKILDACLNGSHEHDEGGLVLAAESWRPIAAALRAEHASALERAAQVARPYSYSAEQEIRAMIPPAVAPAAETGKEEAGGKPAEDAKDPRSATFANRSEGADFRPDPAPWRIGSHYGIHVYQGSRPLGTFLDPADAAVAVDAVNEKYARVAPPEGEGK